MGAEVIDRDVWTAAGEALLPDAIALRRAIHAEPELGLDLPTTTAKVKAALAGLPLEIREGPVHQRPRRHPARAGQRPHRAAARRHGRPAAARGHRPRRSRSRTRAPCTPAATTPTWPCWPARPGRCASERDRLAGLGDVHVPARRGGLARRPVHDRRRPDGPAARRRLRPAHLAQHARGRDRRPRPARSWPRPTPSASRSTAPAATRPCRTTPSTPSRSPARSSWRCRPSSPAGSRSSTRRW